MRLILQFGFLLLLFFMPACKKETSPTIIKGIVKDRKTMLPIKGAVFLIGFVTKSAHGESTKYSDFTTDSNGEFNYTEYSNYDYINGGSNVSKSGYVPNHTFGISKGEENILNITLLPKDAVLKIVAVNQTGQFNSLYFEMINPDVSKEGNGLTAYYFLNNKPLILSMNEEYMQYFNLPQSNNFLFWDFQSFQPTANSSYKDTIMVTSNDTTEFVISF